MTAEQAASALGLTLVGRLEGGAIGAYEVRHDGARKVLKLFDDADTAAAIHAVELAERLRRRGYPAPVQSIHLDGRATLQAWMAGTHADTIGSALITDVIAANALQAGQGDTGEWSGFMLGALREGLSEQAGFALHGALERHSDRTRALLDRVIAAGAAIDALPSGDIAHCDFHHRNLLQADGRLTAVIDWDSASDGDHVADLVCLSFCSVLASCEPGAIERLDAHIASLRPAPVIRAYTAYHALRQVDWSIRHRDAGAVELWLDRAAATMA